MSHVVIAFAVPGSWIGRLVSWWTGYKYSHVALVSPDGEWVLESTGTLAPYGVQVRAMASRSFDEFRCIRHPDPQAVWEVACSQHGKAYDWGYLIGWPFRRNWQDDDKWSCTELIPWAFSTTGKPIIHSHLHRVDPQILHMLSESMHQPE